MSSKPIDMSRFKCPICRRVLSRPPDVPVFQCGGCGSLRLVRCPKCRQVLLESSNVPVYQCGGCGTRLRAKNRNNNAHQTAPGLQENGTAAQTSNSDRSPEGMDPSPSPGAVHPSEDGSQDRSGNTAQRVAGDCNSKQLELSCEDENRRVPHTYMDEGENGAQDQSSL